MTKQGLGGQICFKPYTTHVAKRITHMIRFSTLLGLSSEGNFTHSSNIREVINNNSWMNFTYANLDNKMIQYSQLGFELLHCSFRYCTRIDFWGGSGGKVCILHCTQDLI